MKKIIIGLTICVILINCSKTDKEKQAISLIQHEQKVETSIKAQSEIMLPKLEITKENLFAEFPATPDYFAENNYNVITREIDDNDLLIPENLKYFVENDSGILINRIGYKEPITGHLYYGIEPVYVIGENFQIIYTTDYGYEVRSVRLKGKSIFTYWNQFFDATLDDVKKSWGEPRGGRSSSFYDTSEVYFATFFISDNTMGKITEIHISQEL